MDEIIYKYQFYNIINVDQEMKKMISLNDNKKVILIKHILLGNNCSTCKYCYKIHSHSLKCDVDYLTAIKSKINKYKSKIIPNIKICYKWEPDS